MDQPTRKFLAVLADDLTDAVVARLRGGAASKTELASELGVASRDLAHTLDLLLLAGLVRYELIPGPKGGRPRQVWEFTGGQEIDELGEFLVAMRQRLT